MDSSVAMHVFSALSIMTGRTRRGWKSALETLRLIDVSLSNLVQMNTGDAWKWLGWDVARHREWMSALEIARSMLPTRVESELSVTSLLDDDAPEWLKRSAATPWVFYRGDLTILDRVTVGFSGQREVGEQAAGITTTLATAAAHAGYTVVSGGARGVDMAAHTAVLAAGGSTAVILPQGLITWRSPRELAQPEVADRVIAVSEDVPWEPWNTDSAMRRNRMIVDLSRIFTVPQSGTTGGSHSTGRYALKQHRVTYVPDLGPEYPGNQLLLQHGARLLTLGENGPDLEQMLAESTPAVSPSQTSLF